MYFFFCIGAPENWTANCLLGNKAWETATWAEAALWIHGCVGFSTCLQTHHIPDTVSVTAYHWLVGRASVFRNRMLLDTSHWGGSKNNKALLPSSHAWVCVCTFWSHLVGHSGQPNARLYKSLLWSGGEWFSYFLMLYSLPSSGTKGTQNIMHSFKSGKTWLHFSYEQPSSIFSWWEMMASALGIIKCRVPDNPPLAYQTCVLLWGNPAWSPA